MGAVLLAGSHATGLHPRSSPVGAAATKIPERQACPPALTHLRCGGQEIPASCSWMLLNLTVPAYQDVRGPEFLEPALRAIHQANPRRQLLHLILARRGNTVGLYVRCGEDLCHVVRNQLQAHFPHAHLQELPKEALDPAPQTRTWTRSLRLVPDVFPLRSFTALGEVDPLAGLFAGFDASGVVPIITLTLRPARRRRVRRAQRSLDGIPWDWLQRHLRWAALYLLVSRSPHPVRWVTVPFRRLRAFLGKPQPAPAAVAKLNHLLFEARLTVTVFATPNRAQVARAVLRILAGAFGVFHAPGQTTFRPGRQWFFLSPPEAATLWHPPQGGLHAPKIVTVESKELPPPTNLPTPAAHPGLTLLGTTLFRGQRRKFGLLPDDRRRHLYVVGKTGVGKSTLLLNLVVADLHAGNGLALLDPHGDLVEDVLARVPRSRTNEVVYLNPVDQHFPIGFNILQHQKPHERSLVASSVLVSFKKLYADSWGPRLEHLYRHALLALLEVPGSTLVHVPRLFIDPRFRARIVQQLHDPVVRRFWEQEFAAMPARLQGEAIAPVLNKAGAFLASPILRNILGQSQGKFHLREIMDRGQVLLVNLSKGRLGEDVSGLLGSLLITELQLAALSRADVPERERRDFSVVVDEFQSFSTLALATVLSESRKYRVQFTLAHQFLAQVDKATAEAVFGNVGNLVVFGVGRDADELAEHLSGEVSPDDLRYLPKYHAYARILIEGRPSRPFSLHTLPPSRVLDPGRAAIIERLTRHRFARPVAQVEQEIAAAVAA